MSVVLPQPGPPRMLTVSTPASRSADRFSRAIGLGSWNRWVMTGAFITAFLSSLDAVFAAIGRASIGGDDDSGLRLVRMRLGLSPMPFSAGESGCPLKGRAEDVNRGALR